MFVTTVIKCLIKVQENELHSLAFTILSDSRVFLILDFYFIYLQSESNDFKALLNGIKLLFVRGVAHNVGPQFNVLVAEVPGGWRWEPEVAEMVEAQPIDAETHLGVLLSESL